MTYLGRPVLIQRRAPLTYALLAANILVFIALEASGGSQNPLVLLQWGAKFTPAIRAGQPWRLITAMFLHAGVLHLAVNSYSLHNLGNVVERLFGTPRFALIYLIGGVWGSLASTFMSDPRVLGVGASGAIFGLAGFSSTSASATRPISGCWQAGDSSHRPDQPGNRVLQFTLAAMPTWAALWAFCRSPRARSPSRTRFAYPIDSPHMPRHRNPGRHRFGHQAHPHIYICSVCVSSPAPASVSTAILTCSAVQVR